MSYPYDPYLVCSRGSGKSAFTYFAHMQYLYKQGKISFADYISAHCIWRMLALGESEEAIIAWAEEQMKKEVTVNMYEQLQDRTVNIMMIAKRFPISRMKSEIARYMSEECGTPVECYTDGILCSIVRHAFFDWLQCSDKSRTMAAIRCYFECVDEGHPTMECMLIALGLSQVAEIKEDGQHYYICGFHDTEFSRKLDQMREEEEAE